jgi:hypothetical protein
MPIHPATQSILMSFFVIDLQHSIHIHMQRFIGIRTITTTRRCSGAALLSLPLRPTVIIGHVRTLAGRGGDRGGNSSGGDRSHLSR